MKYIIILILVICLFFPVYSESRRGGVPMEQLTDPSSKHYVPYPFPKTREKIIANLKYQIKRKEDLKRKKGKPVKPKKRITMLDLVEGRTPYRIGRIIKVKNRMAHNPFDYSWLILLMDENYEIDSFLSMNADGRFTGSSNCRSSYRGGSYGILKTKREVLNILSRMIDREVGRNDVDKMERVAFAFSFCVAPECAPMWEIILIDGNIYYYSIVKDIIYSIDKRIPYKKDENGFWEDPKPLVPKDHDYVIDTINEEILVLKVL